MLKALALADYVIRNGPVFPLYKQVWYEQCELIRYT
jgi:hypothetical protein